MHEDDLTKAKSESLKRGAFRVISRDHRGDMVIHDFLTYEDARQYANHVASNWSTEHFPALVFDDNFSMIYEGHSVSDF
ncbi:MAG: hypothetical protein J0L53_16815 [Spirochaetes bacterium]|nr:hypothetical protein [Spirochaetota bacterium]